MIMGPRTRKFVLTGHITLSVGWIGAVAAYIALDLTDLTSGDPQRLRSAYIAMDTITRSVIVPLALASLLTGLLMGVGTPWGLFRHYWVIFSLFLTALSVAVLIVETRTISHLAAVASDPGTTSIELLALGNTLGHSIGGLLVLLVVLVLNVYKPRGMTRYGRRKMGGTRTR